MPDGRTGAQRLLGALVDAGVDTCFANPGTSEMHFVAALDDVPAMRGVLALFEGVATGAADGYGRITGRPAATLLHLGPGLGNGFANLHNARRAHTPVVNVVGDHATTHARYDAPLQSDIAAVAGAVSAWYRSCARPEDVAGDAADAVRAALGPPGGVATLVLPADVSWSRVAAGGTGPGAGEAARTAAASPGTARAGQLAPSAGGRGLVAGPGTVPAGARGPGNAVTASGEAGLAGTAASPAGAPVARPSLTSPDALSEAADALRSGEPAALLLGGTALRRRPLQTAAALAARTGARLLAETLPAHLERGAGIPAPERLSYLAEMALAQLAGLRHLVLVDVAPPASFFAYPDLPSALWPPDCRLHTLCRATEDAPAALEALAALLGSPADAPAPAPAAERPVAPTGPLDAVSLARAVGALLPEDAIVVDESNTAGIYLTGATAGAPPHDWLCLTGGAIGQGLPLATGAAIGGAGRPVLCLEADGSAMYTLQALWTQAREGLDVTTVVLANRSYAILRLELARVGAGAGGPASSSLLDLDRPELDLVSLAEGMGVPASRANSAEELVAQLGRGLAAPGPSLVEAVLPSSL